MNELVTKGAYVTNLALKIRSSVKKPTKVDYPLRDCVT